MRIAWMVLLAGCLGWAQGVQNMDLTGMVGGITSSAVTFPTTITASGGTSLFFSGSASFIGQLSYAYQLPKPGTGYVWFELPVTFAFRGSDFIDGTSVSALNANSWFITPGLRFKSRKFGRVSFYGALGGGLGLFNEVESGVSGTNVFASTSVHPHPVFDIGGGIDVRLSRLLSLRAELRDFVSAANAGGISALPGHNHWAPLIGLAFHL